MSVGELYVRDRAEVIFSRYFPREYRNLVMERMAFVVSYFPEYWDKTIYIELEGAFTETGRGGHFSTIDEMKAKIAVVKEPDVWLLAHELMHGVQRIDDDVPCGEKSCDLFTIARCPELANRPPSYLSIPKEIKENWFFWVDVAHDIAKQAIKKRTNGTRRYIQWFENEMVRLLENPNSPTPSHEQARGRASAVAESDGLGLDKGMHCQSEQHPKDCLRHSHRTDRAVRDNPQDRITCEKEDW